MKALFVGGDDYAALDFEKLFDGEVVSNIIEDIEQAEKAFQKLNPEYSLDIHNLVIDERSLKLIRGHIGDSDYLNTDNIYLETETIKY